MHLPNGQVRLHGYRRRDRFKLDHTNRLSIDVITNLCRCRWRILTSTRSKHIENCIDLAIPRYFATNHLALHRCGAAYDDVFIPPFAPWSTSTRAGGIMSGPDGLLGEEGLSQPTGRTWLGDKALSVSDEKTQCSLDLTQVGEGRSRAEIT